jgi:hypothetical protein
MKLITKLLLPAASAGVLLLELAGCGPNTAPNPTASGPSASSTVIVSPPHPAQTGDEKATSNTATKPVPANAQRITIELPGGYKTSAATVKAGRPVAITFKLKSEAGCGDEVVVPAAKWRKKLKVGQSATVVYTPAKSGALKFVCGMNMYKGSILVK